MDDHEIPLHFICPISLRIMKDPVIVATGITYDRDSIQKWQSHGPNNTMCPVTNQPLPIASDFTPNHNLRRLIQAWCLSVSDHESPPSKQSSLEMKVLALNLIKKVKIPDTRIESLKSIEILLFESEHNRVCFKEAGVVRAMIKLVVSCYRDCKIFGLKEALNVLYLVRLTQDETKMILVDDDRIISSLTWVLDLDVNDICDDIKMPTTMKFHAIVLLKDIIHDAKSHVLERLNRDFFKTIIRECLILGQGMKEGLQVMLTTCTWARNWSMMIESGAVFELIELELGSPEKSITELIMSVLVHLCSSADGRAQFLGHAAGIALIVKRIGKVSPKVDEKALMIISLISKFSATDGVLQEMVRVGTVEKLCMVLQVNGRHSYARDKAREILKRHSNVWKDSPCLDATILTRYPS